MALIITIADQADALLDLHSAEWEATKTGASKAG